MLIELDDENGEMFYLNPEHVVVVARGPRNSGKDFTRVTIVGDQTLTVAGDLATVRRRLSSQ